MVAAIANGAAFAKGRDFAAWLGLVLKQMSTGDRTILGHISKRGNRYLRTLFMQGARVILLRPANWARHNFGPWLTAAAKRLHHNVLATALANKLARIAWTVLAQRRNYETARTYWPLRACLRMRADARGYPLWPRAPKLYSRAGYSCARPIPPLLTSGLQHTAGPYRSFCGETSTQQISPYSSQSNTKKKELKPWLRL
jgi:Transposase IS116/IS110/IS902 family